MTPTEAAHRRIEQIALELLDRSADEAGEATAPLAAAIRLAERTVAEPALECIGVALAATSGRATKNTYRRGPKLALACAAVTWTLHEGPFSILDWRATKNELLFVVPALRTAAPAAEIVELGEAAEAALAGDTSCEVCGVDSGVVTPYATTMGVAVLLLHVGPCCRWLFAYPEPVDTAVYRRVGRNDPCPCGSGRKLKRCHGDRR